MANHVGPALHDRPPRTDSCHGLTVQTYQRSQADPESECDGVHLRPYPYPYRAMLAVCSDLDETPDRHAYWQIMRFLNTTEHTPMGPGVGLEVGNSIYFDMRPDRFAYWTTDDVGKEMVRALIRSGHIDCLHSYGDLATSRAQAGLALDELAHHDCKLGVWVDHGRASTNFGADIMRGHGDEIDHVAYHADLTTGFGIHYVWRGRVTSITGQDAQACFGGVVCRQHPVRSTRTLAKEMTKHILARCGSPKYEMHSLNVVLRPAALRDGRRVYEFMRCNPHWNGVSSCDRGAHIGYVLREATLSQMVDREGASIIYTHLGKIADPVHLFDEHAVAG
ncbi:MAG: hypothetical protein WBF17_01265, partial [Phycisphaerae bacterium]